MKFDKLSILFLLALALPAIFVFKALILPGPVVWGDAPFFYPQGLQGLFNGPYIWTSWGKNFGGINEVLWIYPLMFLYGFLHVIFNFNNDLIIRIIFYFPAVILSFITPIIFVQCLGYSRQIKFFASLVYGLNTYFLLLIDGGQVGVALAYGIFPFALLNLHLLATNPKLNQFLLALITILLLIIADPRFALISLFTALIWVLLEGISERSFGGIKNLRLFLPLLITLAGLSSYWLVPFFKLGNPGLNINVSGAQFVSLLNSVLLFQPHWPGNEFGVVSPPPLYFIGIPFLVFGYLFWQRDKKSTVLTSLVLIFAFLAKGETPPLGNLYAWVITNMPFANAFRDSTKFFTPLILFSGILIGFTIENLQKYVRAIILIPVIYVYFLFIIHPALLGNLNGLLAGRQFPHDFEIVHQKLAQEDGFFRTLWFPERSPFSFYTQIKPALDAKELVNNRPFAAMNVGTFDAFNFLHNSDALQWFDLMGIRYLFFPGDQRKTVLDKKEQEDWNSLLDLAAETKGFERTGWGTDFPIYKAGEVKPHIFGLNKVIAVVGGDDIYKEIGNKNRDFRIGNQGFIFLEDGKLDPLNLENAASSSAILLFNKKTETDFKMSFLKDKFIPPKTAVFSQWAAREAKDYLRWKYELLTKGIETHEFDYGEGIAFSTQPAEKIKFTLSIPAEEEYFLAVRSMAKKNSDPLKISFAGRDFSQKHKIDNQFEWSVLGPLQLKFGKQSLVVENPQGTQVLNVVSLISKQEWDNAENLVEKLEQTLPAVVFDGDNKVLNNLVQGKWLEINYTEINPVAYKVTAPKGINWVVLTDSYNPEWSLVNQNDTSTSLPFYSMINGFYVKPGWGNLKIVFEGQKYIRWGIYWFAVSLTALICIILWLYPERNKKND